MAVLVSHQHPLSLFATKLFTSPSLSRLSRLSLGPASSLPRSSLLHHRLPTMPTLGFTVQPASSALSVKLFCLRSSRQLSSQPLSRRPLLSVPQLQPPLCHLSVLGLASHAFCLLPSSLLLLLQPLGFCLPSAPPAAFFYLSSQPSLLISVPSQPHRLSCCSSFLHATTFCHLTAFLPPCFRSLSLVLCLSQPLSILLTSSHHHHSIPTLTPTPKFSLLPPFFLCFAHSHFLIPLLFVICCCPAASIHQLQLFTPLPLLFQLAFGFLLILCAYQLTTLFIVSFSASTSVSFSFLSAATLSITRPASSSSPSSQPSQLLLSLHLLISTTLTLPPSATFAAALLPFFFSASASHTQLLQLRLSPLLMHLASAWCITSSSKYNKQQTSFQCNFC